MMEACTGTSNLFIRMRSHSQRDRWTGEGHLTSLVRPPSSVCPLSFTAAPGPVEVDLTRSALLIIDMQNDFLHADGWFASIRGADVEPLNSIINNINALSAQFRQYHADVIHINWGVRADLANLPSNVVDKASHCGRDIGYGDELINGPVLVAGSWGAQSVDAISDSENDLHVAKHRLSGFCDNELDQILRRRDIRTLFFTGVNIDRCVFATLIDATFQGYDVVLVEDACATTSPTHVSDAITYLVRLVYGFTALTKDLVENFNSIQPTKQGVTR